MLSKTLSLPSFPGWVSRNPWEQTPSTPRPARPPRRPAPRRRMGPGRSAESAETVGMAGGFSRLSISASTNGMAAYGCQSPPQERRVGEGGMDGPVGSVWETADVDQRKHVERLTRSGRHLWYETCMNPLWYEPIRYGQSTIFSISRRHLPAITKDTGLAQVARATAMTSPGRRKRLAIHSHLFGSSVGKTALVGVEDGTSGTSGAKRRTGLEGGFGEGVFSSGGAYRCFGTCRRTCRLLGMCFRILTPAKPAKNPVTIQ